MLGLTHTHTHMHALPDIKQIVNKHLMYNVENATQYFVINYMGKVWKKDG